MTMTGIKDEPTTLSPVSVRGNQRHIVVTSRNGEIWDMILVRSTNAVRESIEICHKEIRGTPVREMGHLVSTLADSDWTTMSFVAANVVKSMRCDDPCSIGTGKPVCFQQIQGETLVTSVPVSNIFSLV